ncbi:CRIB domain-containing protein RIC7-like [Macadamia integrifolia]|uniref:CRIB domain-containing protein RIC7-like n=1 Tax=Macadamia integrifolia TaxID=60698 RepID=UPI001C4F51B0|nr:CRIB domain-containing protein RIC7-like [Macadamia integrifolia]
MFAESNHADPVEKQYVNSSSSGELGTSYCHSIASTSKESTSAQSEAAQTYSLCPKKQKELLQSPEMSTKMKGLLKGLRYISQIFDNNGKEQEMEIGYPTDVKHVAHIGWDGPSKESPSWMNEYKPEPEVSSPGNRVDNESNAIGDSAKDLPKPSRRQPFLGSPSSVNAPKQSRRHQSTTGVSISSPSREATEILSRPSRRSQNASSIGSPLQDRPADQKKSRRKKSKESGGGSTRPSRSKPQSATIYTSPFSDPGSGTDHVLDSEVCPKSPLKPIGDGEGERGNHGIS